MSELAELRTIRQSSESMMHELTDMRTLTQRTETGKNKALANKVSENKLSEIPLP